MIKIHGYTFISKNSTDEKPMDQGSNVSLLIDVDDKVVSIWDTTEWLDFVTTTTTGDVIYSQQNYVVTGEPLSESIDALDVQLKLVDDNKVDNSRVLTDVPENAIFTDTTFDDESILNKLDIVSSDATIIVASDETSDLSVNTDVVNFIMPDNIQLTDIIASVNVAPDGSSVITKIYKNGVSVLSTNLSIDLGSTTSVTSITPVVISDNEISKYDLITVEILQVGAITAGAGLKIYLIGDKV